MLTRDFGNRPVPLLLALMAVVAGCGNGGATQDATVTIQDGTDPECDGSGCDEVVCGDGTTATGDEGCDDGNLLPGDGCSAICQREVCGNAITDPGEDCDPPNAGGGCNEDCKLALSTCGNRNVDPGEECDDGNTAMGDGCRNCRKECGDSILDREIGEECEPAFTPKDENGVSTTCTATCRLKPFCGDAKVNLELGEQCDPVDGLTCVNACKLASTSDGGTTDGGATCTPMPNPVDGGTADGGSVGGANLVPNGAFDADLAGWTFGAAVQSTFVADQGAMRLGAARVTHTPRAGATTLSVDGIQRCVTISAGEQYDFEAQYFNQAGQPGGTRALAVVLLYPTANCSGAPAPGGPGATTTTEAGKWFSYKLKLNAASGATASVLIKLGVVVSPNQTGTALWDDASLRSVSSGSTCGNCKVDPGETCDDGNRTGLDGCSAMCRLEGTDCGNGKVDPGEACDTGATSFSGTGTCTPICTLKTTCDDCATTQCRPQVDACLGLAGVAEAGSRKGIARNVLCGGLRECVARSGCSGSSAISTRMTLAGTAGAFLENCYCGTSGKDCLKPGRANGSCRAEIEAALETSDSSAILQRVGGEDPKFPIVAAMGNLEACEKSMCASECASTPSCGNGKVQERTATFLQTFQLSIAGKKESCSDALTPSKLGCSFEECDGGFMCDDNCFLLKCGNGLLQMGEACDDGNVTPGDGCDATCKAEFTCGDNQVADKFGEQCDPPNTGKLCSMAEFTSSPTSCGCGTECKYKVCGNGIVQQGEQCDPPNGSTCGADCQLAGLGECIECMLLAGETNDCPFITLLKGNPDVPGFEQGCLDNKPCYDNLRCGIDNLCPARRPSPLVTAECYCGLGGENVYQCEQPGFEPKGPCKAELDRAYKEQFGVAPANPTEFLANFNGTDVPMGRRPALVAPNLALDCALRNMESLLTAAGVATAKINSCLTACLGPP